MERELLRSQCESYLLGTLEGEELKAFEAALRSGDSEVTALLRESTDFVAQIGLLASFAEPSTLVRTRLLKAIAPVIAMPRRGIRLWQAAGWAVAACLAVIGYFGWEREASYRSELAESRRQVESLRADTAQMRKVMNVIMSRDTRLIRLATSTPEAPQFRAFWSAPGGLVLTGINIPAPRAGRTMQLWVVPKSGANPISAGVFHPTSEGQVLHIAAGMVSPEDAKALAISDEPDGGSAQPSTTPSWVGAVGE